VVFTPEVRLTAALTLLLLCAFVSQAEDWPQWRGPNRDGVCGETGLLESFPAGGLAVRWRVPAGWGFSSPVVAQGRVYLADSEVVKPAARERVRCFEETTGKALWTHAYEVAYPDWAFDPNQEIGPVATPVVQDGRVYTLGRLGHLFCLDARTGAVLWRRNLENDYQVGFAPGTPSPLIEGDLLILFIGGKPGACVIGLHKDTGKEVWRALDESLTFSSPIVISSGGKKQLIVWTQESVTSLDPAAGKTYWRQRLLTSSEYAVSTPVFHEGQLLVGGLMFELDPDKPAARVLWPDSKAPSRRIFSHTSTALFWDDHVFTAKSSGELICLEAATGALVWESDKVTDLKNGASIHLTPNGDSVLLYTDRGELIRARLTSRGYKETSRAALLEPTFPFGGKKVAWSPPAYADRHVFARSGKELVCASLAAADAGASDKPATPAEQYQALLTEYDRASSSGVPLTDAERLKFVGQAYKHRNALALKFLELAEKYPNDPVALDALMKAVWQVNGTPWPVELVGEDKARGPAFELLQRDHIRSDRLGPLCQRVSFGFCNEYESFLRAVLAKNPHKRVQALACLALAHFLNNRLQRLELVKEEPELAKEFADLFGKTYLEELQRQDREKALTEIETRFEQAAEKYGDVQTPDGGTVGERARAELFEVHHLRVGKEAPDIEGEDQDGKRFKLSDYRGKVVLLDFWSFV
jgi:outer membrane protein assembly factor BamB